MLANLQTMRTNERQRIDRQRTEAERNSAMGAGAVELSDMPKGAAAPMSAGMIAPDAAPAGTGSFTTSTPVPDVQKSQYIRDNVTPQADNTYNDKENRINARYAPPAPRPGDPIVGGDWQPGTGQAVALRGPAGEKQRLEYLRSKDPVPNRAASGNESMGEAKRITAKPVPAATGAAPASADFNTLAQAVKMVESAGDPNAVSPKGAVGTMQTMPETLRDPGYGVRPAQNNTPAELERVGRDYLQAMIAKYPNRIDHALAAYNWGPGNTDKWIAAGADPAKLPKETRDYIPKVLGRLTPGEAAPTAQAGAPTATTAQAPAAAPSMSFTPEQINQLAVSADQELRMAKMQLAEINRQLSVAPTAAAATSLREKAVGLVSAAYGAQLKNAFVQGISGNQDAIGQLANAAGVQYAQTPQGFVAVRLDPAKGQYVAVTQPAPMHVFVRQMYDEASGAAAKARDAQTAAMNKVSGEIAVKRVEGENAVRKAQAEAQGAIQKAIAERRLTQADIKGMEFDPVSGKAYVRTNSGVFSVQPGVEVNGMVTAPELVPLRGLAG
jgi:soluble lytic murein transglycosylase-like protein